MKGSIKQDIGLIKDLIEKRSFNEAEDKIFKFMVKYPNNPEPHNLFGILLEKTGEHLLALKHFRVAITLDSSYKAANENLSNFSSNHPSLKFVYDDKKESIKAKYVLYYDEKHIGHLKREVF